MAFKIIALAFFLVYLSLARNVADATIGINWGRQNAQKLMSSNVVDLLLQNGVRAVRLFTSEDDLLRAFAGSGIELTLTVGKANLLDTYEKSLDWVRSRLRYFNASNVRRVNVADFAFSMGDKAQINTAIEAMQCLQKAINDVGYGDQIKVTIPDHSGALKMNLTSLRPSDAEFKDNIKQEMAAFLRILERQNAPFIANMFPISSINQSGVDVDYAFLDNKSTRVVTDINGATYTNLFELSYDSFVWAINKLNVSNDIKVVVGQVGWPTDGSPNATAATAERYFKGLLPFVASNKGTPMRPGAPIDIFIHSLTDENKMYFINSGSFTRHFGIYRSNGKPKYKIDLSGQGRDIYPTDARGIMRMPERWCIFNGNRSDIMKVRRQVSIACSKADCTTLAPGASCSHLPYEKNISYAFNMHFQFQYQDEKECDFEGLGTVSVDNPSTPECVFPVEVVRAEQSGGKRRSHHSPNCLAIFLFLLSIFGTLFWN